MDAAINPKSVGTRTAANIKLATGLAKRGKICATVDHFKERAALSINPVVGNSFSISRDEFDLVPTTCNTLGSLFVGIACSI
jgi:hypothetical protein